MSKKSTTKIHRPMAAGLQGELGMAGHDLVLEIEELRRLAYRDHLTGLGNRRFFEEELHRAIDTWFRYSTPLSLVLVDLDHFKAVNDRLGHAAGDALLKKVGAALAVSTRAVDSASRVGGDEFAVIMPMSNGVAAEIVAHRIRNLVSMAGSSALATTASVGIATLEAHSNLPPDKLFERADRALYRAKALGRNRIEASEFCRIDYRILPDGKLGSAWDLT